MISIRPLRWYSRLTYKVRQPNPLAYQADQCRIRSLRIPTFRGPSRSESLWVSARVLQIADSAHFGPFTMGLKGQYTSSRAFTDCDHPSRLYGSSAEQSGRNHSRYFPAAYCDENQ